MKIGIFTDGYLPSRHGVATSIESFRLCLEKMGHEVLVCAPYVRGYKDSNRVFRLKSFSILGYQDIQFSIPAVQGGKFNDLYNMQFDIIHAQSPFNIGILGKIISKRQNIPIIYTHHTDYPEYTKVYLREKIISPYLAKKITSVFANSTDAVIAPSQKVRESLINYNVTVPIHLIPTGLPVGDFRINERIIKRREELKKELRISSGDKIVFYLGRICKEKNIEFLIKAFVELSKKRGDFKFLLVGNGTDYKKIRALVKKLNLENKVIMPGFIDESDKAAYYHLADVFWFASKTDTQGLVILEADAAGLPIVALKDSAYANLIIGGENGYILPTDSPQEFAAKTIEIVSDDYLKNKFSKQSLKIAESFSDMKETKKLVKLYSKLIEGS